MQPTRIPAGSAADFVDRDRRVVLKEGGHEILVVAAGSRVFAVGNRCTHLPAQLRQGLVLPETCELHCPVHMGSYSLITGEATAPPCEAPLPRYDVDVSEGEVYVILPSGHDDAPETLHPRSIDSEEETT